MRISLGMAAVCVALWRGMLAQGCSPSFAATCPAGSVCVPRRSRRRRSAPFCAGCRAGQYAAGSACAPCPSGTYSGARATACAGAACLPGRYGRVGLAWTATLEASPPPCAACAPGTFQPLSGASSCLRCPAGTTRNSGARLDDGYEQCDGEPCAAGRYGGEGGCRACPDDAVAPVPGAHACERCSSRLVANSNRTFCVRGPRCGAFRAPPTCHLRHAGVPYLAALGYVMFVVNVCRACGKSACAPFVSIIGLGVGIGFTVPGGTISDFAFYLTIGALVCVQVICAVVS